MCLCLASCRLKGTFVGLPTLRQAIVMARKAVQLVTLSQDLHASLVIFE